MTAFLSALQRKGLDVNDLTARADTDIRFVPIRGGAPALGYEADILEDLAEELADVIICADLVGMATGVDLERAVRDKFNATSVKLNLPVTL